MKPKVIADASPVRYLVSIGQIDLLRQLFELSNELSYLWLLPRNSVILPRPG